jgi:uncharacterized membrane protein YfcA
MTSLTALLGVAIGLVMGVTGAGGGVLAVPALVGTLGLTMQQAAPIALVGVALAAVVGTTEALWRRVVRYRAAAVIALAGAPTSAVGVGLAQQLSDLALRTGFIGILLLVAWRQLGPRASAEAEQPAPHRLAERDRSTGRFIWTPRAAAGFAGIGAVTGFVSGLFGVAGGFVLVPLLARFTDMPERMLVGTSLMVTALVTGFGAVVAAMQGPGLSASVAGPFAAALVIGMLAGRWTATQLPDVWVRRAFAVLVLCAAAGMAVDLAFRLAG